MKTAALLSLVLLIVPAAARASSHKFFLGAGVVAENMARYTSDEANSGVSLLGRDYVQLSLRAQWGAFVPSLGFTPLGIGSPEGGQRTRLLTFRARRDLALGDFDFLVGPGLLRRMVSGSGGTVTLNNGNSTTESHVPSTSSSQNLLFLSVGLGRELGNWRVDFDAWIFNLLGAGRSVDGVITVGYGL